MYKIIITEEQVGPSLAVGRTEAEAVGYVVTYIAGADWSASPRYDDAWHATLDDPAIPRPTTLEELDAWLCNLHETTEVDSWESGDYLNPAQVAQRLAQTTAPFAVEAYDDWIEHGGCDCGLIVPCYHIRVVWHAEIIIGKLASPLALLPSMIMGAGTALNKLPPGNSCAAALAGAAVMHAAAQVTTRVRLVDVVAALELLEAGVEVEAEEDLYSTSRQAIQDRLRIWNAKTEDERCQSSRTSI